MLVVAYEAGGTTAAGLVGVVQLLPAALIAPFAALPADRYRRDRVLAAVYLVIAAGVDGTAAALALDAPFALVYALAALATVATTGVRPAESALLPELAPTPKELAAALVAEARICSPVSNRQRATMPVDRLEPGPGIWPVRAWSPAEYRVVTRCFSLFRHRREHLCSVE